MAVLLQNIWRIGVMLLLLLCSAFFSGSETAFFNISRKQIQTLRSSANRLENLAASLIQIPNRLLTSILSGNMIVNVLFFAFASVLSINLGKGIGPAAAGAAAVLSFMSLLLFGEMLPKSLAYSNSKRFCLAATPICYLFVRILAPLLGAFESVVVKPAVRLFAFEPGRGALSKEVNVNLLRELIESSRKEGLISKDENQLLLEILEFSHLKVRHVMRPRVDMLAAEVSEPPANLRRLMHQNNVTKIPLYSGDIDNIVGMIHLRKLLLQGDMPVEEMLDKIQFVPEQKTVESLIELFQQSGTDMVIAVDEYGGIAGQVLLDDIIDELIEPIMERSTHTEPIEQIGPMEYRLAGDLAIHDWAHAFGIDPGKSRLATMGGFTASLLEKIPRPGDVAYLKNMKLTVEKVGKHRIESLIVTFESIADNNSD